MRWVVIDRLSFRFRRWSRKRYAVFSALGRVVTIGALHSCVLKQLGKKCVRLIALPNSFSVLSNDFLNRVTVFFVAFLKIIKGGFVCSRLYRDVFVPFGLFFCILHNKRQGDFLFSSCRFSFIRMYD